MGWAIWVTGPPGAGVSALVQAAARVLGSGGLRVPVLEADELRAPLAPSRPAERELLHRALAMIAAVLADGGGRALVTATGDRRACRDLARAAIARFAEVSVVPVRGAPPADHEPPLEPDLRLDPERGPVSEAVERLVRLARQLEARSEAPAAAAGGPGWTIWITGRPGSGKTSLAEGVARALGAQGVAVRVLDTAWARRFRLREAQGSQLEQEVAHRALACAARHLAEAGTAVIVDATAPRRAWRDAARAMIPRFAEVQLVCSEETCVERERAVRWGLGPHPAPRGALPVPHVAPDYEDSVRAELTLRTDAHDLWTTVEQVLFLARRLQHAGAERAAG
jgi:adenylylsulfate kinase